jgi:nickel/cobalt transporter (NicO) family protein
VPSARRRRWNPCGGLLISLLALGCGASRADTVASLLGNFTINQYCGLDLRGDSLAVHYAVVFGQLPALRELHEADADGNGVTSQGERDAYVGKLAPAIADGLEVRVDGVRVPLRATQWASSLPNEQGGFSLRIAIDFSAALPAAGGGQQRRLQFANRNYSDRVGWREIVVQPDAAVTAYETNAYNNSLTGGLTEALRTLPQTGPLDERAVHLTYVAGPAPAGALRLAPRPGSDAAASRAPPERTLDNAWLARETRRLVESISSPRLNPRIAVLALLGALLLGAVHALSPGHGKTIVGAYLIGSRGTPRHAAFLGLTVTATHTAGVFLLGFATLYASRFIVPERLFPALSLLSALLILGMGIVLLVRRAGAARLSLSGAGHASPRVFVAVPSTPSGAGHRTVHRHSPVLDLHSHCGGMMHSHGGGRMHSHLPPGAAGDEVTWQSLLTLGISGGLVPCPSAMVLLLAAVALHKTAYGMLLVVSFSVGLALTLTAVGLAFLYARNRFGQPRAGARWPHLLPVLSAIMIIVLGMALCFGALVSFRS